MAEAVVSELAVAPEFLRGRDGDLRKSFGRERRELIPRAAFRSWFRRRGTEDDAS